jgi:MFS family permease
VQGPRRRRLPSGLRAFGIYNYRLYFFGQLGSLIGSWMQRIAQAWLVLQISNSPLALGLMATLQYSPITLFSLYGGVIADRLPKRRLLLATQTIQMCQSIAVATLATLGIIELWHIYVLACVLGLANAFDNPSRQSLPAEIVPPEDLTNAVALNSVLFNSARIIGPSIAGFIIAAFGVTACFWINSVSFLSMIGALLALRPSEMREPLTRAKGRALAQIGEGLSYAARTREICLPVILMAALGTFGFNWNTMMPLIARYMLEVGPTGLGVLFSALGAGSITSALLIATRKQATERALLIGAGLFSALLYLVGVSTWMGVTVPLLFLLGCATTLFSTTANTRMQLNSPISLRGRVMGLYALLFIGTTPFGSAFIGYMSETFGVRTTVLTCASLCGLGLIFALAYAWRTRDRLAPAEA